MTKVQTQNIQKSENKDRIIYFFLILGGSILSFLQFHFALLPLGIFLSMTTLIFIGISLHFIVSYNDFFVPASLITLSFVLRTFFPGFLLLAGYEPGSTHLQQAWFSNSWFWRQGLVMASLGIYLYLLFFLLPVKPFKIKIKKHFSSTLFIRTTFSFFIIGILLLIYYIYINFGAISSFLDQVINGLFRSYESKPGTARLIFLSNEILNFSVLGFGLYFYQKKKSYLIAIAPAVLLMLIRLPLGGRVNAVQPLLMLILGIWYINHYRSQRKIFSRDLLKFTLKSVLALFLALFLANVVLKFRSRGIDSILLSIAPEAYFEYLKYTIWTELGFISPFAFAIKFGELAYPLPISRLFFTMYTGYFLDINHLILPGEFLVLKVNGTGGWGLHTGAINDMYLSYGYYPMLVTMSFLGLLTKFIYIQARNYKNSLLMLFIYLTIFPVLYWAHFETVLGIANILETFLIWTALLITGITVFARRK